MACQFVKDECMPRNYFKFGHNSIEARLRRLAKKHESRPLAPTAKHFLVRVERRQWLQLIAGLRRENTMLRSRAFTVSNSEVVTTYSCLAGKIRAISFCVLAIRSGVGGCVEKILGIVPGCRFSSA